MTSTIAWLFIAAAALPLLSTIIAKAGGKGFSNTDPRAWLNRQQGYRARANAAQQNLFEGLPLFYTAVLFALYNQIDLAILRNLMALWIVARMAYVACYLADKAALRSLVWFLALALNVAILERRHYV